MSLSSYLASKYLTAEPSSSRASKKRKRKTKEPSSGLIIADDDTLGWENAGAGSDDDEGRPVLVGSGGSAEFRRAKKSAWKSVGSAAPADSAQVEADAILAGVERERAERAGEDDGGAVEEEGDDGVVKMESGAHAGLQTAAQVTAQFERRKRQERARFEEEERVDKARKQTGGEETVYRDATGKRIDLQMRRADKRKELDELERKKREEEEAQRGDVQIAARQARKEALEEAKFMPLARTRDDEDMNREMKEVERWNDPAAQFVKKKNSGKSASGRPLYKGAAPPNRHHIRPGYRWDGVDRSNGWEAERFKYENQKKRNKQLNFEWQEDA